MIKFNVISRYDEKSNEIKEYIKKNIKGNIDEKNPELVITVGGDGTFLRAVHKYSDKINDIIFVSINTGTLGFFSTFQRDSFKELINTINTKNYSIIEFSVLEFDIEGKEKIKKFAINEITIQGISNVEVLNISINDNNFETIRGSGICIATSIGSTAFNKSLNGAVVDRSLEIMQLTEIASINSNSYRSLGSPLILNKDKTLLITSPQNEKIITFDHETIDIEDFKSLKCNISKSKLKVINLKEMDYFSRIRKSFLK